MVCYKAIPESRSGLEPVSTDVGRDRHKEIGTGL